MKCASEKLLHYLSPVKIIVARYSTSFFHRGKFFWDQAAHYQHRKMYKHNNYVLLDSGFLVCYTDWVTTEVVPSSVKNYIYLGEGMFHGGCVDDTLYNPPAEAYE